MHPENTPCLHGVTSRDGELSEGRTAILPSDCEREFISREAFITGNTTPLGVVFYSGRCKSQAIMSKQAKRIRKNGRPSHTMGVVPCMGVMNPVKTPA